MKRLIHPLVLTATLAVGVVIGVVGPFRTDASEPLIVRADPKLSEPEVIVVEPQARVIRVERERGPCEPRMEHAIEVVRFAQHSHVPWYEWAREGTYDPRYAGTEYADPDFQAWWIDRYQTVLEALTATCYAEPNYPLLMVLPGLWESYPSRAEVPLP